MKEYASPVELVKIFHTTYGQPIRTSPVFDAPEKAMRHDLIDEEIEELTLAFATYDFVEVIDALADIVYVVCGAGLTHGTTLDVRIERPLVPGSFSKDLVTVEPLTETERKFLAAAWEAYDFDADLTISEQFTRFRGFIKGQRKEFAPLAQIDSDEYKAWQLWQEINRKLDDREATVAGWFEEQVEYIESTLVQFNTVNEGLHSAVHTDELKAGWLDLIALSYRVAFGYGVDLDVVLEEVQASNLSKLAADGSVLRREDGKVLKGPNFFAPDIAKVLESLAPVAA